MKNIALLFCIVTSLLCGSLAFTADHGHEHNTPATSSGLADVAKHKSCPHCGMDRDKFAHSRMLITYTDNVTVGICSLHCAATELKATRGKTIKTIEVADLDSKKLLAADTAFWIIGGNKKGVMTRTPKWAFATKARADEFIKKQGGTAATYKDALALAEKE